MQQAEVCPSGAELRRGGRTPRLFQAKSLTSRTLAARFSAALASAEPASAAVPTTREVPPKAQSPAKVIHPHIDEWARSRYSQAQIKDLVAYANPRSFEAAQSLGSLLRRDFGSLLNPVALVLSLRPPASPAFTANNLLKISPGGSACGSVRHISRIQRRTGGHRPL